MIRAGALPGERRVIRFIESADDVEASQLQGFFSEWAVPPSAESHLRLLRQSEAVVLAIDDSYDQIVGFVTAITDGVLAASIPWLEVLPSHRGAGIGSQLMRRMLLQLSGYSVIGLTCEPEAQRFYGRFGMVPSSGMMVLRRAAAARD